MSLDEAVAAFALEVGADGPVAIAGTGSRGGPTPGIRTVRAPAGIDRIQPAEMTIRCGAGTTMGEVASALAEHGQCVAIPAPGSVGGALAVGHSGIRRLGWGPTRDTVLQLRYVSSAGDVVKVGGPTVKNVSGFDLCRLLVGSRGTLGFIAEAILRTRPLPAHEQWFCSRRDPWELLRALYRPTSLLWDGRTTFALLEGHADDIAVQAAATDLTPVDGPPELPPHRWSLPPAELGSLRADSSDSFVAEIGVGIVHHSEPSPARTHDVATTELHERIKSELDPRGRLNPGVDVLAPG